MLTVRNNRLDSYSYSVDTSSLPSWVSGITYGTGNNPAP